MSYTECSIKIGSVVYHSESESVRKDYKLSVLDKDTDILHSIIKCKLKDPVKHIAVPAPITLSMVMHEASISLANSWTA